MIAVTFALPVESADFVRLLGDRETVSRDGLDSIRGNLHGQPVAVLHTGVGAASCRESLNAFLRAESFDYLISAGLAGALDPELKLGDLLIAENYSSRVLLESPHVDLQDASIYLADVVTAPRIVEAKEAREKLALESGAAAVDMETAVIAKACADHDVPMMSLRAISDTLDEPFPAPADVLFDIELQKTPAGRLALYLLTHPAAIGRLKNYAKQIAAARRNLTSALSSLLRNKLL
jgi:adenosylhomocysteine nucleosidase